MGPRGLVGAVGLLTRVPVPAGTAYDPVAATLWFPVVGALTGALVAGVLLTAGSVLPAAIAALLAVAFEVLLTGALHLDGLADTADAAGGRDRDERLAIMRDHAVGVYGTAAVVLSIGLRASCLAALLAEVRPPALVAVVVLAWTLSRAGMLVPAGLLGYARENGTGHGVVSGLSGRAAGAGLVVTLLLVSGVAVLALDDPWRPVAAGVVGVSVVTAGLTRWAARRLGGVTGDVLGAVAEAGLAAALVALVAGLAGWAG